MLTYLIELCCKHTNAISWNNIPAGSYNGSNAIQLIKYFNCIAIILHAEMTDLLSGIWKTCFCMFICCKEATFYFCPIHQPSRLMTGSWWKSLRGRPEFNIFNVTAIIALQNKSQNNQQAQYRPVFPDYPQSSIETIKQFLKLTQIAYVVEISASLRL